VPNVLVKVYWHCPYSMRNRVYVTVRCPSVCLSVPAWATVLSCLVWRCELSWPDSQTGAFCVWSVPQCVGRRSATAGRTPTQNALARRSIHTATPDKTVAPACRPPPRRRPGRQLRLAARPPTRSDVVRHKNVNVLWTATYD